MFDHQVLDHVNGTQRFGHGANLSSASDESFPDDKWGSAKDILDFGLSLGLLLVTSPLMLVAALLVKLTSPGPVIYSQIRSGKGGKPFTIYKIRTMTHNCEALTGARWCVGNDPRVTKIGWFLRATHIDELPQLWNVLCGQMSLIGPRPERPEFVSKLEKLIPRYTERLALKPGLTGLAQIQLPPDSDLDSVRRKLQYDLFYHKEASLGLDLRILLGTALHVLKVPFVVSQFLLQLPGPDVVEGHAKRSNKTTIFFLDPPQTPGTVEDAPCLPPGTYGIPASSPASI